MDKFTFTHEWKDEMFPEHNFENKTEFSCENLDTVVSRMEDFLRGAGFAFDSIVVLRNEEVEAKN